MDSISLILPSLVFAVLYLWDAVTKRVPRVVLEPAWAWREHR